MAIHDAKAVGGYFHEFVILSAIIPRGFLSV